MNENMILELPDTTEIKLKSEQGLSLAEPAAGQLHRMESLGGDSERFVLVLDVHKNCCDVLPGSLDGMMAGAQDIVLPKSVMGGPVMLALNSPVRVRRSKLGAGFARLDADVFRRIVRAFVEKAKGSAVRGFVSGYPYVSEHDERRCYRQEMVRQVLSGRMPVIVTPPVPLWDEAPVALAAGDEKQADILRAECRVAGFDGCVLVVYDRDAGRLSVDVYGADGNASAALDGWTLADADGNELADICGSGIAPLTVGAFNGACFLIATDASVHELTPVRD